MCVQVGLGNDVRRLGWRQHRVREELLHQVGVVRLQELHEVGVHMLVDLAEQLLHLELLLAQLGQELVHCVVEVDES